MDKNQFVIKFDQIVKSKLKKTFSFDDVKKLMKEGEISLFQDEEVSSYSYLKEVNNILDRILNIIYSHHILVKNEEVILRSELAKPLCQESFINTISSPSLWKKKGDEMAPEYVYSIETDDTKDIYENRFVKYVFKMIENYLAKYIESDTYINKSIKQYYKVSSFEFSKINIIDDIYENEDLFNYLNRTSSNVEETNMLTKAINKSKRIRFTSFYKGVDDSKLTFPIIPTNILLHDINYNKVFKFYKHYFSTSSYKSGVYEEFNTYVIFRLFNSLINNRYKVSKEASMEFVNGSLRLDNFSFAKDGFTYRLSKKSNNLLFEVNYLNEKEIYEVSLEERMTYKENDNRLVITLKSLIDYSSSIELSLIDNSKDLLDTMLKSMRLVIDKEDPSICPVCGNINVEVTDNYTCSKCHSKYIVIEKDHAKKLWIKRLGR